MGSITSSETSPIAGSRRNHLEEVLRIIAPGGKVTGKTKQSAQNALAAVPKAEAVVDAWRCGIVSGSTAGEGVAVLTGERLSVFDRRGFASLDRDFHLLLSSAFSIEAGPGATQVTFTAGTAPVTLELFDAGRAEAFHQRFEGRASRPAAEQGWWSRGAIPWPGWLGTTASWAYLGGDPARPRPVHPVRLHVGPAGVTLGDVERSTEPLVDWSGVAFLHVLGTDEGRRRAEARGLLRSEAFAASWGAVARSVILVLGYATGEEVFLGGTGCTEAELRTRLFPIAAAMPPAPGDRPFGEVAPPAPASDAGEAPPSDLATQLERLAVLHRQGLLDDGEFVRAKQALLG